MLESHSCSNGQEMSHFYGHRRLIIVFLVAATGPAPKANYRVHGSCHRIDTEG
jgi:hypothetical protein